MIDDYLLVLSNNISLYFSKNQKKLKILVKNNPVAFEKQWDFLILTSQYSAYFTIFRILQFNILYNHK
jgi:hypothetical protein